MGTNCVAKGERWYWVKTKCCSSTWAEDCATLHKTDKQPRCGARMRVVHLACVCVYVHCYAALRVLYPLGLNGSAGSSAVLPAPVPPLLPACLLRPRNNELPMLPVFLCPFWSTYIPFTF